MDSSLDSPLARLDRSDPAPLFRQIADRVRALVLDGELVPGERLPAIRTLARELGVNRSTVQMAYRELETRGLVETKVGSGTRVKSELFGADLRDRLPVDADEPGPHDGPWRPRFTRATEEAFALLLASEAETHGPSEGIDFSRLMPDERLFPLDEFRGSLERVLDRHGSELLHYGPMTGYGPLREVLAAHLTAKGTPTTADQVLATSGAQQGIELALRAFAAPGEAICLSAPTYHQMFGVLRGLGLEARTIPDGDRGPDDARLAHELARPGLRLLYAMPNFANPTGRTWDLPTRERFLETTADFAGPILEDDFEADLRFRGREEPTLRSLAPEPRVLSLGTVSKGLFPGARVGWVAGDATVIERLAGLKRFSDLSSGMLLQAALADFIDRGHYERHLEVVRAELREKHARVQAALQEEMTGFARWTDPDGGYALWVTFPCSVDSERLAVAARERGLLVAAGQIFEPDTERSCSVRLTVARAALDEIDTGIRILSEVARGIARTPRQPRSVFV